MKLNFLIIATLVLSSGSALAGVYCSKEQTKQGCYTESYDCNKPTHYTCRRCMCPSHSDSIQSLKIFEMARVSVQCPNQRNIL